MCGRVDVECKCESEVRRTADLRVQVWGCAHSSRPLPALQSSRLKKNLIKSITPIHFT